MTFFARPDLSDIQFKQLSGSTLTMSGATDFVGILKSKSIEIDGTATTVGQVLTFDGNKIKLMPSVSGGSSGSSFYYLTSPTTCTVGGLPAGSLISGCTISRILEEILVPEICGVLTAPSFTFAISPATSTYEVGANITVCAITCFSRGSINPQECSASAYRSGLPVAHVYTPYGCAPISAVTTSLSNTCTLAARPVVNGNNTISAYVAYSCGAQPKGSKGTNFGSPLAAGTTTPLTCTICGLYPYFYGKVASGGCPAGVCRPAATASLITGGTKCVCNSDNTIYVNFNSTANDYIWFAIPSAYSSKTCWYINALNNGNIGGVVSAGGNLFPDFNSVNSVTTVCWAGQTYKIYISNYQSAANTIIELRN
jgi:hypothetical protein